MYHTHTLTIYHIFSVLNTSNCNDWKKKIERKVVNGETNEMKWMRTKWKYTHTHKSIGKQNKTRKIGEKKTHTKLINEFLMEDPKQNRIMTPKKKKKLPKTTTRD